MPYYAVANGRTTGIFLNWNDCNYSVKGFKNALYKKFDTEEEAEIFMKTNQKNINNITTSFDTIKSKQIDKVVDFIPDYYVYTDGACSAHVLIMEKIML